MAALQLRPSRPSQVPFAGLRIPKTSTGGLRLALAASVWQPQERLMLATLDDDDAGAWKRLFKVASAILATSLVLAFVF